MLEAQVEKLQRNSHAAHVGRIEHSNELHEPVLLWLTSELSLINEANMVSDVPAGHWLAPVWLVELADARFAIAD